MAAQSSEPPGEPDAEPGDGTSPYGDYPGPTVDRSDGPRREPGQLVVPREAAVAVGALVGGLALLGTHRMAAQVALAVVFNVLFVVRGLHLWRRHRRRGR